MAKNIIQDVVANNRRSIRQISIDRRRRPARGEARKMEVDELEEKKKAETASRETRKEIKKKNAPKMIIWTIALLSIIFLLFSVTSFFSTATVTVIPKTARVAFNDTYIAKKNALPGELRYEVMTLQKKMSKQLEATETENLKLKASGKIVVYNNFSAVPQKLIINTRFESEEGLIYKIPKSIIVPGIKSVGGKKVPGSVETLVFADEPGEKYNMKISDLKGDFKIAGFKGGKKYNFFYARLKTDIAGGSSGLVKKVPGKILDEARKELRADIKSELLKEAYATKPQSSVLLADAYYYSDYVSLPDTLLGADKIEINENATFHGIIFDEAELNSYVVKNKLPDYDGAPVNLVLDDNTGVSLSGNSSAKPPWEGDSLSLSLKGGADVIWTYDEALLQKSLAGQRKSDLNRIISSFLGIAEVRAQVRPYWKRSFPNKPEKIKVENFTLKK